MCELPLPSYCYLHYTPNVATVDFWKGFHLLKQIPCPFPRRRCLFCSSSQRRRVGVLSEAGVLLETFRALWSGLPDVQAGFRKGRGTRDQIANIRWIMENAREWNIQKHIYFCFIDYAKAFDCVDHNKLWKIVKEMGLLDHLTCLLRNLYAGQEATVRTAHGTTDWFQIAKGVCQGYILSPCLINLYAECIMRNARLDESQAGIKTAGEISITSDMQMTPDLWQKVKRN